MNNRMVGAFFCTPPPENTNEKKKFKHRYKIKAADNKYHIVDIEPHKGTSWQWICEELCYEVYQIFIEVNLLLTKCNWYEKEVVITSKKNSE